MDEDIDVGLEDAPEPEAEAGLEPEAEIEAPEVEETPVETWAGPSRDEWEQTQHALQQISGFTPVLGRLGEALEAQSRGEDPLEAKIAALGELSPIDENYTPTLLGTMADVFGRMLDDRLGPVQGLVEERQKTESQQTVDGWLSEATGKHGDLFDDTRRSFAEQLAFGVAVKEQIDGHQAVGKAADIVADIVKKARSEGRAQLLAEQKEKAGAGREPSGAAALGVERSDGDEMAAARRFMERHGATV